MKDLKNVAGIIKDNILINNFVGRCGKERKDLYWTSVPNVKWVTAAELEYHSSWDWIMTVVRKIEAFNIVFNAGGSGSPKIEHSAAFTHNALTLIKGNIDMWERGKTLFDAVYKLVLVFIKWYNENVIKMEKKLINGTTYHSNTPDDLIVILEEIRSSGERVVFDFGDVETGKSWGEDLNIVGRIGRSNGEKKIPILLHNVRSTGGGAVLDHCILGIKTSKGKRVLYELKL